MSGGDQPGQHLPMNARLREVAGSCALAPPGEPKRLLTGGDGHVAECNQLSITVNVLAHYKHSSARPRCPVALAWVYGKIGRQPHLIQDDCCAVHPVKVDTGVKFLSA